MRRAEDVVRQFRRDDVRQMAGAAHQIVMGFRREVERIGADRFPEFFEAPDGFG